MNSQILQSRRTLHDASPAAYDEVFAALPVRRALDPQPFRDLAADLDHQHERLQQLLRDIEAAAASE